MKITIEQEGKEAVVFEGEIALVSVGTYDKFDDAIKKNQSALVGPYPLLSRLVVGICAQMSQGFQEWHDALQKARDEAQAPQVKKKPRQSGEGEMK